MRTAYLYIVMSICFTGCVLKSNNNLEQTQHIKEELSKINTLLRDTAFALEMASGQDSFYYINQGQAPPAFFPGPDTLLKKSFKEEKIAINLAGFYAVECGIGALGAQKAQTPIWCLQQIVNKTLDLGDFLLLNRFANATWKTGQAFRGLERITRDNFIIANFLSAEEIKKDEDQVIAAASMLLDSLKDVSNAPKEAQLEKISQLLKNKLFALEMARHMEAAYYKGQNKPVPPFLTPGQDTLMIDKKVKEEKIATNIAGFLALECGVSYLATTQNKLPSDILKSVVGDNANVKDKQLLERFANATWKASQPFRGLERITRNICMPFDQLPKEEIKKDWDQLKSAAAGIQKYL